MCCFWAKMVNTWVYLSHPLFPTCQLEVRAQGSLGGCLLKMAEPLSACSVNDCGGRGALIPCPVQHRFGLCVNKTSLH